MFYCLRESLMDIANCGNTWTTINKLLQTMNNKFAKPNKRTTKEEIKAYLNNYSNYFYFDGKHISIKSYYDKELSIYNKIKILNQHSKNIYVDNIIDRLCDEQNDAVAKTLSGPDISILTGGPGTGKTTLAKVIANTTSADFVQMNATTSGKKDMEQAVSQAKDAFGMYGKKTILFIDEIHRLSPVVEEYLYSAMEDFRIDIMIDKGPSARSIQIELNPFTLVGATTRSGLLTSPLRARFGINCHLEYYDHAVLTHIIERSAKLLCVPCTHEAATEIAMRSRGTPRIGNALLRRVRDFAQVKGSGSIDLEIARYSLEALNIDKYGLDEIDNKILSVIIDKFKGGPVGLTTIATALGEDPGTLEEVYEPYLIKEGFIKRTPRGREVTDLAYTHLNRRRISEQGTLF